MKKILTMLIFCFAVFSFSLLTSAYTPYESKIVTLPTFSVTVNEQEYNYNEYETYPLFVHNGVTYFPLTYNNAIILNLIPTWNVETCSHEYAKGNPDLPKQFFRGEITNTTETKIDESTVRIDSVTYQVHHLKETKNPDTFTYHYQINEETSKTLIDGKNLASLSDYPILFNNDMVYIPLSWQFVTEVLGGTITFDTEKGLEVRVDNFITTLNGDSEKSVTDEVISYTIVPNDTYYIKDKLSIVMSTDSQRLVGPVGTNLTIKNGETETKPKGFFGYFQKNGPLFTIENDSIKTVYYTDFNEITGRNSVPCIIDIETGEISET